MNEEKATEACLRFLRDGLPAAAGEDMSGAFPLALDVDGDIAVVTLLVAEDGGLPDEMSVEGYTFHRRNGEWMALGGGGGSAPADPLTRRPAAELGRHLRRYGGGRTVRNGDRLLPWGAKYVSQARLRAAAEVVRLRVGKRLLDVPEHGHAAVVWGARRGPVIEALDAEGAVLDKIDLS
ncbi:hypothetical protein [Actinomadura macrotermitis]|uniref:Uncharacterized protein n=1 Tax=Actinomadura macrotermitis TaxID=2585200 RepID=A0A7K0C4C1_9ACTN|nr:hypothetical protein [Actinomadura macrotermitis]MQY08307.1 hypothetical protein [Actinomadura macrotermitis]